jgi:PRTRC genetic system protein E
MFKELAPILRDRAVLLTVTLVDADQIRVNIVPNKLKDGDNDALTTPLSVTGTAEELDSELSSTIVGFVDSHLQMKNTLKRAKAEMDAASKAAQAEARAKSKTSTKAMPPKAEVTQFAPTAKPAEPSKPAPLQTASLFDVAAPAGIASVAAAEPEEDLEPFIENEADDAAADAEELDDAARVSGLLPSVVIRCRAERVTSS